MTTPTKAVLYRVRRTSSPAADAAPGPGDPAVPDREAALRAVEAEGLTPRQLRMARRMAAQNGIDYTSDHDAVLKLRQRGIDPSRRGTAASAIAPDVGGAGTAVQLPQAFRPSPPPAMPDEGAARVDHIMRIQRDIVRRRRRQLTLLTARLVAFVLLPSLLAGVYFFIIATPMYATHSAFVIQQAESTAMGNLGGFFKGTQFATSQDAITVQSYLQSRDAMLRLDKELGFRAAFSNPAIDPLQRLSPDATTEDAYGLYQDHVKIGYDPTEGIVKMEVIAPDPALSQAFAETLIRYAEEQVDRLSLRLREAQMKDARAGYEDAERKVQAAQAAVLDLQQKVGVLDPRTETGLVMNQIGTIETHLRKKELELQALLDNAQPNAARVEGTRADIARLQSTVAELRAGLTRDQGGSASLAAVTGQLRIAEGELTSRQLMMAQALQQMETARIEANRQTRYLSMGVAPIAPDAAAYPRAFENTVLALLIFSGIYLMLSLTAAILREQVST